MSANALRSGDRAMTIISLGLHLSDASASIRQRFEAKCGKPNNAGCIEWLGSKTRGGYGVLRLAGKGSARTTAHRIAWVLKRGVIAPEILVLHKCDNPSCVNVDHLFLGTPENNTHDMMAKNRHGWRNGMPWQKLNATDAERMRDMRRAGHKQQQIADWMNVSRPLVSMVLAGKFKYSQSVITA